MTDGNIKERKANEKFTLSESRTSLYIQLKSDKTEVKIDGGIIEDDGSGQRKCDYLLFDEDNKSTHLIELKGTVIDRAYSQLENTVKSISEDSCKEKYLMEKLKLLEAYIVSPAPKIPQNVDSKERSLAKMLAAKSSQKQNNIVDLITYVRVVSKGANGVKKDRYIIISGECPLSI